LSHDKEITMNMIRPRNAWLGILAAALVTSGCATSSPAPVLTERDAVVADAQVRRERTSQQLKAMPMTQLAEQLAADSQRGREPFNSMAFAEAVSRRDVDAQALAPLLGMPDRSSLLGLLALRHIAPQAYRDKGPRFRVSVLVDALKTSRYFNAFGLPHVHWEEAAQAIVAEGEPAIAALLPLLADERPAPVWGSEDYTEYRRYDYRVQDYALALILAIRKQALPATPDRAERLQLIRGLTR
jgi:hypothetical protein